MYFSDYLIFNPFLSCLEVVNKNIIQDFAGWCYS